MIKALFIHTQPSFLERIRKESNDSALTTTSMIEAMKWISNPAQHISGIYLSPDDTSFSALHFIDLTLSHRPTIPIFLLEGKLAQNKTSAEKVTNNTHVKGIFSGSESYTTLTAPLKVQVSYDASKPRAIAPKVMHPGYISIPVSDFFTGSKFPYDIFIASDEGDIRLFAPKDSEIDPNYLSLLAKKSAWVLVRDQDISQTRSKIQEMKETISENKDISFEWRTAEVMANAKNLLDDMRKAGVSDQLIQHTQSMLGDLYGLISTIDADEDGSLFGIIDRAKKCDRAVFCASYAMIMCKHLRYEKTATLEILGFASVLQDVSLYNTPFGDLSEKPVSQLSPDEAQYYLQHPVLSSDLVSHYTDIPQVTLQVVRQHHERKNKTGFPNKIGGAQLHAMAEILSLINSYYDVSKETPSQAEIIQQLNRNIFPNYSENIIQSFKNTLGAILKDKIQATASTPA